VVDFQQGYLHRTEGSTTTKRDGATNHSGLGEQAKCYQSMRPLLRSYLNNSSLQPKGTLRMGCREPRSAHSHKAQSVPRNAEINTNGKHASERQRAEESTYASTYAYGKPSKLNLWRVNIHPRSGYCPRSRWRQI